MQPAVPRYECVFCQAVIVRNRGFQAQATADCIGTQGRQSARISGPGTPEVPFHSGCSLVVCFNTSLIQLQEVEPVSRERRLPLDGVWNFRDLGGYPAGEKTVRWANLYRSSRLSALTDRDCQKLEPLGITLVCDLRLESERADSPNRLDFATPAVVHAPATTKASDELDALFDAGERDPSVYRAIVLEGYRQLVLDNGPSWSKVVRAIINAPSGASVVHCSAGQDRTGMVVAIVLLALGVSERTVIKDYCLTAHFGPPEAELEAIVAEATKQGRAPIGSQELRRIFEPTSELMRTGLETMRDSHGSVQGYLRESLLHTDAEIEALRGRLLE